MFASCVTATVPLVPLVPLEAGWIAIIATTTVSVSLEVPPDAVTEPELVRILVLVCRTLVSCCSVKLVGGVVVIALKVTAELTRPARVATVNDVVDARFVVDAEGVAGGIDKQRS